MSTRTFKRADRAEINLDTETTGLVVSSLVLRGDISALNAAERTQYYVQMCESLGLNPAAQPFSILKLNGKEILYPTRGATDQLASIHRINREIIDGPKVVDLAGTKLVYAVCKATHPNGRIETAVATVPLADPMNVLMKCECVPLDSEILTRGGWKLHHQLTMGEDVLAFDVHTGTCVWTPLRAVSTFDDVPVVAMRSEESDVDFLCTPNHSWVTRDEQGDDRLREAQQLSENERLVFAAPARASDLVGERAVDACLLGWNLANGAHNNTAVGKGSRPAFAPTSHREGGTGFMGDYDGGVQAFQSVGRATVRPRHTTSVPALVRALETNDGAELPGIVASLSVRARNALFQALLQGAGDGDSSFLHHHPRVIETFQMVAVLLGHRTVANSVGPLVHVRVIRTQTVPVSNVQVTPFGTASVWCPTTDLGTWVMRQRGHVVITGNTKAKRRATLSLLGLGMLDESELETIPSSAKEPGRPIDLPTDLAVTETPLISQNARSAGLAAESLEQRQNPTEDQIPPVLARFITDLEQIELPGEAVSVWLKHRGEIATTSEHEKESAWKMLCRRTEDVGRLKNAKTWLTRAIREEEMRRARPENTDHPVALPNAATPKEA